MTHILQQKDPMIQEIIINAQLNERKIYLLDEYDRDSTFKVIRAIERITSIDIQNNIDPEKAEPIWLVIDSYGGCLHSYYNLASCIKKYQSAGWVINTVGWRAMSAGFFTLILGTNRYVSRYGSFMCHDQRAFEYGYKTMGDKRVELQEWEKEWEQLKEITIEHTLITDEQLEWYVEHRRDWNMNSKEMIELGCADYIDEIL